MQVASAQAALDSAYSVLGLVDASIATVAREHECAVLTDDLDLYLWLLRDAFRRSAYTEVVQLAATITLPDKMTPAQQKMIEISRTKIAPNPLDN